MPVAQCQKCGENFRRESHETWKKLCYHCWKEKQEQSQIVVLRQRLANLEDDLEYQNSLIASQEGLIEYQEQAIAHLKEQIAELTSFLAFFNQHSRFLLLACHPDRNPAHTETASAVTQALLNFRQQSRQP